MVGAVTVRAITFVVLAACGALCQERGERLERNVLPDAPSTLVKTASFSTAGEAQGSGGTMRAALAMVYTEEPADKESAGFFERYLYPTLRKRNLNYHPTTSSSFVDRATYAVSRIFITRDDSGNAQVNTSYLLAVLSSAMMHTAYRPYWRRSAAEPFSDFGSTIGNDAGMNVLHEFGPGLGQVLKEHAPRFVTKIEERVGGKP